MNIFSSIPLAQTTELSWAGLITIIHEPSNRGSRENWGAKGRGKISRAHPKLKWWRELKGNGKQTLFVLWNLDRSFHFPVVLAMNNHIELVFLNGPGYSLSSTCAERKHPYPEKRRHVPLWESWGWKSRRLFPSLADELQWRDQSRSAECCSNRSSYIYYQEGRGAFCRYFCKKHFTLSTRAFFSTSPHYRIAKCNGFFESFKTRLIFCEIAVFSLPCCNRSQKSSLQGRNQSANRLDTHQCFNSKVIVWFGMHGVPFIGPYLFGTVDLIAVSSHSMERTEVARAVNILHL